MKKTVTLLGGALCLVALSALLANSNALTAVAQQVPPIFKALIINDDLSPVPVSGDVVATVDGTVDVEGTVDVASVPSGVTNALEDILEAIEGLEDNGPVPFAETIQELDLDNDGRASIDLAPGSLVSQVILQTENDDGILRVCNNPDGPGPCAFGEGIQYIDYTAPDFLDLTFATPIPATGVLFQCRNTVEDCELILTVVGTRAP
jgi:hypothetical protein